MPLAAASITGPDGRLDDRPIRPTRRRRRPPAECRSGSPGGGRDAAVDARRRRTAAVDDSAAEDSAVDDAAADDAAVDEDADELPAADVAAGVELSVAAELEPQAAAAARTAVPEAARTVRRGSVRGAGVTGGSSGWLRSSRRHRRGRPGGFADTSTRILVAGPADGSIDGRNLRIRHPGASKSVRLRGRCRLRRAPVLIGPERGLSCTVGG